MTSPLRYLLAHSRGPAGQSRTVDFDTPSGPFAQLATLLTQVNGFFACNAGIEVFRAGSPGLGPEVSRWNHPLLWKDIYNGLADALFCFGQDLFGVQFAVRRRTEIVTFHPESAQIVTLGTTLDDWATWLLDDLDVHGCRAFATAWQHEFGALHHDQRLIRGDSSPSAARTTSPTSPPKTAPNACASEAPSPSTSTNCRREHRSR